MFQTTNQISVISVGHASRIAAAARGICSDHQQTTAHVAHHRWALPMGLMSTENLGMVTQLGMPFPSQIWLAVLKDQRI